MDCVEATLFDGALSIDIGEVTTRRFVTVFVQSTPNKLWIDDSKDLLAGVVQRVNVTVEAGSSIDYSKIDVRADPGESIEFLGSDGEWSSAVIVNIPPLGVCARYTFELVLCLLMDAGLTASPAIRKAKISFDWLGRTWSVELPFIALLIMTSSTSMLESKTLFELEIARAVGHAEEWTVVLENAVIEAVDPKAGEEAPNKLGKLINKDLGYFHVGEQVNIFFFFLHFYFITLFELEIARAVGHAEEWTVVLENAVIEAVDPKAGEEAPNKLGKLINKDLGELIPNVVASLIWVLPITGELPISHKLSIDYRVKSTKEANLEDERDNFIDRLYTYRETFDLHLPKVS
ncbi:unnamed protein product [Strongylus vulgaris]|uniref:Uncharacterized protein n=1 Tax=Strongylus vulgaris TaxID=40348 RepID=A0A3P7JSF0_STRVU|nr:unnamed protein product [Strongylus vulgaris]